MILSDGGVAIATPRAEKSLDRSSDESRDVRILSEASLYLDARGDSAIVRNLILEKLPNEGTVTDESTWYLTRGRP